MQRRKFLQGIAASIGAAAMPLSNLTKAAAVISSGPAKIILFHYGWACVHAQRNNGVSAADISRVLKNLAAGGVWPDAADGNARRHRACRVGRAQPPNANLATSGK